MFPEQHRNYGVVEVCPGLGVKVLSGPCNYDYIYRGDIVDAYWTGGCTAIIVEFANGSKARYTSFTSYDYIYS